MFNLKQFISNSVCLSCDGCCRFSQEDTVWRPLFMDDEIGQVSKDNIMFCVAGKKKSARVKLVAAVEGGFVCPCLDTASRHCKIYARRPFDCRLYPFLLARRENKAFLAADRNCPGLAADRQSSAVSAYRQYLLDFLLSPAFVSTAKIHPEIIQSYPENIDILDALPALDRL